MMVEFKKSVVSGSLLLELAEHALVAAKCPSEAREKLAKLVAMKFSSSKFDKPDYSPLGRKLWKHLPEDIQHGLNCLLLEKEYKDVTIWFCAEPSPRAADDHWIKALEKAIQ